MTSSTLRLLIRKLILEETEERKQTKRDDKVLGEPDLSAEDERDNPTYNTRDEETVEEINAIGAGGVPAGTIRGHIGPMDNPMITKPGPSDHLRKKTKKKRKK